MKLLFASLLVLWSCLVCNVQQSSANHLPPTPAKALSPVSETGSFPTPDSMLTVRLAVVFHALFVNLFRVFLRAKCFGFLWENYAIIAAFSWLAINF